MCIAPFVVLISLYQGGRAFARNLEGDLLVSLFLDTCFLHTFESADCTKVSKIIAVSLLAGSLLKCYCKRQNILPLLDIRPFSGSTVFRLDCPARQPQFKFLGPVYFF
jgi:hypothetical protein